MKFLISSLMLAVTLGSVSKAEPVSVDPKLKAAFAVARLERVAVVGIGDSNQLFGGHGYSAAMTKAFYHRFGSYGTGVIQYRQWKEKDGPVPPSAPEEAKVYSYWYVPAGQTGKVSWQNGQLMIPADHSLGVQGHLRFHLSYCTLPESGGSFQPVVRLDTAPWTILASAPSPIESGTTRPFDVVHYVLDLPRNEERKCPLQFMPTAIPKAITGPFLASHVSCENLDKTSGVTYSTLYAMGGQSLYDMLLTFKKAGSERLAEYFSGVFETLNGHKTCVVMITSALNDRNEPEKSLGPNAGLASSSPEGYEDNLMGLVQTLQAAWVEAGGTAESLHIAFMPSHALGDPDDARLVAFRQTARSLAARLPNASFIDIPALVPYREMVAKHFFDKGTDTNPHLDKAGYEAIANALVSQLTD